MLVIQFEITHWGTSFDYDFLSFTIHANLLST